MTADEILKKHEDANEVHFHGVDRKWIIDAMEEYASGKLNKRRRDLMKQDFDEWYETLLRDETSSVYSLETQREQMRLAWMASRERRSEIKENPALRKG